MQIIPSVDVLDGRVVRLLRGDYDTVTDYGADPVAAVRRWGEAGASLVHVVDLAGARSGVVDDGLWPRLAGAGVPFQAGGGLRTVAAVASVLSAGAARAVVGTAAVWEPDLLAAMVAAAGAGRIVAAVDVRSGRAEGAGWRDGGRDLATVLAGLRAAGVAQALVTAIARDGTGAGPDYGLLAEVAAATPGMAVIASGGVGSLDHVRELAALGVEAAIVGRALYEGAFTLAEAQAAAAG